jgi:hypothetical protein
MNRGDEECRQYIKKKNEVRSKWLQQKTRASQELYKKRRIEANVLIKQEKSMDEQQNTANRV